MQGGCFGQMLRIDATRGTAERVPLDDATLLLGLGGAGLGALLLTRETPPGFDPLGPEAAIVFAFGPLGGTPLTTSAKLAVVAKSPLTQRLSDALTSSDFALQGKRTGFDAIVITGLLPATEVKEELVAVLAEVAGARVVDPSALKASPHVLTAPFAKPGALACRRFSVSLT